VTAARAGVGVAVAGGAAVGGDAGVKVAVGRGAGVEVGGGGWVGVDWIGLNEAGVAAARQPINPRTRPSPTRVSASERQKRRLVWPETGLAKGQLQFELAAAQHIAVVERAGLVGGQADFIDKGAVGAAQVLDQPAGILV